MQMDSSRDGAGHFAPRKVLPILQGEDDRANIIQRFRAPLQSRKGGGIWYVYVANHPGHQNENTFCPNAWDHPNLEETRHDCPCVVC